MLKVAKLYKEPEQSLLPPSRVVNSDDTAEKSSSRTSIQRVIQPKAPTDLKPKKNRIPPSSQPKSSHKSLDASESAEEQVNQPKTPEAEKSDTERLKTSNVDSENSKLCWIIPSVHERLLRGPDITTNLLRELRSGWLEDQFFGDSTTVEQLPVTKLVFDSDNKQGNNVSHSDHIFQDDNASAERLSLPDHLDHICKEVCSLHSKLGDMESSITHQVSAEIKPSLPALVTTAL
ncbi:hypothetical protein Tco_0933628 [Tanacetum coccineum]